MFLPSHIASGFILIRIIETIRKKSFMNSGWLWLGLIAATIPDVDGIFSETVAGHHSVLHTPIFWMGIWFLCFIIGKMRNLKYVVNASYIIFAGAMIHLITDWATARTVGIQWLFPFSNTDYHFYAIHPEYGQVPVYKMLGIDYLSFYFYNRILIIGELGVNIIALGLLISRKKTHT